MSDVVCNPTNMLNATFGLETASVFIDNFSPDDTKTLDKNNDNTTL